MEATTSHRLNVSLLSAKLAKQAWWNTFWAKLAGFQEITDTNGIRSHNPAPNSVVQIVRDFVQEGRDNMLMAMLMPLTEDPVYGDTWLKGTGEPLSLKYLQIYVNQVRKAVTKLSGNMSNQRLKIFNLMEQAQPALVDWWSKWLNAAMFYTLYCGVSPQLAAGSDDDGINLKVRWHPNQYVHNHSYAGTLSLVGTEKYLKTGENYYGAFNGVTVDKISAAFLSEMLVVLRTVLLIEPIVYDDGEFYLFLVHPDVLKQAKADSTILQYVNHSAYMGALKNHPAIKGKNFLYYEGICIVEERTGVRTAPVATMATANSSANNAAIHTALAGTYGWTMPPQRVSGSYALPVFGNIVLGKNALGLGIAENLRYTQEVDDHENTIEIGSRCIQGANRVEYFSDADTTTVFTKGTTGALEILNSSLSAVNQSSAIIWTGSS